MSACSKLVILLLTSSTHTENCSRRTAEKAQLIFPASFQNAHPHDHDEHQARFHSRYTIYADLCSLGCTTSVKPEPVADCVSHVEARGWSASLVATHAGVVYRVSASLHSTQSVVPVGPVRP